MNWRKMDERTQTRIACGLFEMNERGDQKRKAICCELFLSFFLPKMSELNQRLHL
jgi:hypothetical protein